MARRPRKFKPSPPVTRTGRRKRGTVYFEVKGKEKVIDGIKKYHKRAAGGYSKGLEKALIFLKKKSNEIAPIKTTALIKQSTVVMTGKGYDREGAVVYGPFGTVSSKYALIQHEMFEQKRVPGRRWKYLEAPFRRYRMEMLRIIAAEIKKVK